MRGVSTAIVGVGGRLEVARGDADAALTLRDFDCVRPIAIDISMTVL